MGVYLDDLVDAVLDIAGQSRHDGVRYGDIQGVGNVLEKSGC